MAEHLKLSLSIFNSNIGVERVVDATPVEQVRNLTHEQYKPDASTPLFDAIGQVIEMMDFQEGAKLIIIQTDGEENCSQKFNKDDIIKMVGDKTKEGWQFVYLGCDLDAMAAGMELGIAAGSSMSYFSEETGDSFAMLARSTARHITFGSMAREEFFAADPDEDKKDDKE